MTPRSTTRQYSSARREQQAQRTRADVLAAARRLFVARGWSSTGMRDVASEAGVAVETVYSHFTSKTVLLRQVIDIAVVGDDVEVPLAERPEFLAMGAGSRTHRIRAAAHVAAVVNSATAPFARLLREAAPTDASLAAELASTRARQRSDIARGLTLVLGRAPSDDELATVAVLVSPDVYLLHTELNGWDADRYREWLEHVLAAVLPRR